METVNGRQSDDTRKRCPTYPAYHDILRLPRRGPDESICPTDGVFCAGLVDRRPKHHLPHAQSPGWTQSRLLPAFVRMSQAGFDAA
jgi:hypothetical protein